MNLTNLYTVHKLGNLSNILLVRIVVLEVLKAVESGAFSEDALERNCLKYSLCNKDRAFAKEISYGVIRKKYWLDGWIDYLGKLPSKKQPPLIRLILHLGLYQIFCMNSVPLPTVVNTSVELTKVIKLGQLSAVVNGILRASIRARDAGKTFPLPNVLEQRLSMEYSLPVWLIEKLIFWCGIDGAQRFAIASNKTPSIDLRVNRLRARPENVQKALNDAGLSSSLIEDCPNGLSVSSGFGDIRNWPGYKEGFWCVQDRSSQWVSTLLEPQPGEQVLDACSAPGGKSTHIAELMNNQGSLLAVDLSKNRLQRVTENADRLGINCLRTIATDATKLVSRKDLHNYFNRILIDAPCSGLGTLARHPDARWRMNPKQINQLILLQEKLLESLLPLLHPRGRLVYSTCTIHFDENINQIDKFLSRHSQLKLISQEQRWPDPEKPGDGFFAAVLEVN